MWDTDCHPHLAFCDRRLRRWNGCTETALSRCAPAYSNSKSHTLRWHPLTHPVLPFTERVVEPTREVPACIDTDGRESYLAIAKRAQTEAVNLYTVLVLGAEMYRLSRKLKTA